MKWIELIQVRITKPEMEEILNLLKGLANKATEENNCQEIKLYRHKLVYTDLSIFLFHDTPAIEARGSDLGLRVATALREFGMVDHNSWSEIDF